MLFSITAKTNERATLGEGEEMATNPYWSRVVIIDEVDPFDSTYHGSALVPEAWHAVNAHGMLRSTYSFIKIDSRAGPTRRGGTWPTSNGALSGRTTVTRP